MDGERENGSWHKVDMDTQTPGPGSSETAGSRVTTGQAAAEMNRNFSATSVAEAAGKVMDLKGLCKPETFGGEEKKWQEWRFRMDNLFQLIGIADATTWAATAGDMDLE